MGDISGYLLGEFFSVVLGVVLGASIVGICWSASAARDLRRDSQPAKDALAAKDVAEAELLQRLIDRERGHA